MKHYRVILALPFLLLLSCKKDRVCNCTITTIGTTKTTASSSLLPIDTSIVTPLSTINTNRSTFEKVSKRKAKNNCFDKTENVDETTYNNIPGLVNITNRNTGTRTYRCTLE